MINRRDLVRAVAAGVATSYARTVVAAESRSGVALVLPSVSANALALKVWTVDPQRSAPRLSIDAREISARPLEAGGRVWGFFQPGLEPATSYSLRLRDHAGGELRRAWTLKTFPAGDAAVEGLRVLVFTCAGGDEARPGRSGQTSFLSLSARRLLLDRALSFEPDIAIANGDHVYWDQSSVLKYGRPAAAKAAREFYDGVAVLDERLSAAAPSNQSALTTILGRQVAAVYEDRLASTPTIFVVDDHDYFENDLAGPWGSTLPPREFTLALQRRTARLAYPYSLGAPRRSELSGASNLAIETVERVNYGQLAEFLLYDCRRRLTRGRRGVFLDPAVERYIVRRTHRSRARQLVHVPSTPFGWTAGKWAEWYEDRGRGGGNYGDDKNYWEQAWFDQHQRLLRAITGQPSRPAIAVSGDLHAGAAAEVLQSGDLDLSANPLTTILSGPLGTGDLSFPSAARGELPWTPAILEARQLAALQERNGFTLLDITPDRVTARLFAWRPLEPMEAIASLEPRSTIVIERRS